MLSLHQIVTLAAVVGSGLVAGLCFAFSSFGLAALRQLGAPQAIRAMQSLNARIPRSSAMAIWFGTLIAGVAAALLAEERTLPFAATGLYAFGAFVITRWRNIPLNEDLDRVDPDAPDAEEAWRRYHLRWTRWNSVRTVVCALASAGFALAASSGAG